MSAYPDVRRTDKLMAAEVARAFLLAGRVGRVACVSADGQPYCIPLVYVLDGRGHILFHNSTSEGHFRRNIDANPRVCFEVDEVGEVFDYGRFECDSSLAYQSVIAFGRLEIVASREDKKDFCNLLMEKYGDRTRGRPKGFFPRLSAITVYSMSIEHLTGKATKLPPLAERWPSSDSTKTPNARPTAKSA